MVSVDAECETGTEIHCYIIYRKLALFFFFFTHFPIYFTLNRAHTSPQSNTLQYNSTVIAKLRMLMFC